MWPINRQTDQPTKRGVELRSTWLKINDLTRLGFGLHFFLSCRTTSSVSFLFFLMLYYVILSSVFPSFSSSSPFSFFLVYDLPCRSVCRSIRRSVRHISELRLVFALLLLPNRPRLYCRVSGLVNSYIIFTPTFRQGRWEGKCVRLKNGCGGEARVRGPRRRGTRG